jgi:hypothetical protein
MDMSASTTNNTRTEFGQTFTLAIRTADGKIRTEGDRVFNFYDLKWGVIRTNTIDAEGWFSVDHEDGTATLLNGERISTRNLTGMAER